MNSAYNGLRDHFGASLAKRIYSCAMLMKVYETDGIEVAIRYTIGALKRMRQQGTKRVLWIDAVERLENEQVEGRHYNVVTAFSQEVKRIEDWNKQSESEHKAARFIVQAIEAEQERMTNSVEDTTAVKLWIAQYWASVSTRKSVFLGKAMRAYQKGALSQKMSNSLKVNYTPRGVGPLDFVELLVRYA
jgi:hypothetical protein